MDASSSSSSASAPPPASQPSAAHKVPMFDAAHADALVAQKDWRGLEKYLAKIVADITGLDPQDVAEVHPDLFIIPRKEEMLKKMEEQQFDGAIGYFDDSVRSLLGRETEYRPFDLDVRIEHLDKLVKSRSLPDKRKSIEEIKIGEIRIAVSDYFHLYFANAINPDREGIAEKSMWQFAMKSPLNAAQAPRNAAQGNRRSSRPGYRCLACQWIVDTDSHSITSLGYHFAHTKGRKACMRVTQHIINRINAMASFKEPVPDLAELIRRRKKRKGPSAKAAGGLNSRAVFQKVKAAYDISTGVINQLGTDASAAIDHATLSSKVLELNGILLELKSEIQTKAPEALLASSDDTDDEYNNLLSNLPEFDKIPIPEPEKWL